MTMNAPTRINDHTDGLLLSAPPARDAAQEIYAAIRDLPIISPHGHVPIAWLADNKPFPNPTALLITPDHYVTRLLHANGAELADLGVGRNDFTEEESRRAFRTLAQHWPEYLGTPVRLWLEKELSDIFGIGQTLSERNADALYDTIDEKLHQPDFRPRALFERFHIEVLTTTDDPCSDLSGHEELASDSSFVGRVVPTFRPDKYLEPVRSNWPELTRMLGQAANVDTGSYDGFCEAMCSRRRYFKEHGAISSDHSHRDLGSQRLSRADATRIYAACLSRQASDSEMTALRRHLFNDQARMAQDDGLVMTVHPSIVRNHDLPGFQRYGVDIGADIPLRADFVEPLRPLLNEYGNNADFHFVAFTTDETSYSREIAPLAGYYRSFYIGDPWWFIDAPDAMLRFREAVTETAGFSRQAGFVDDTRAFCSIPARHDISRRTIAVYLGRLVAQGRLDLADAQWAAHTLVQTNPRKVFKL